MAAVATLTELTDTTDDRISSCIRELALLTEPGAPAELASRIGDTVAEATELSEEALIASGGSGDACLAQFPDEAFVGADAATCWHLRELACDLADQAQELKEAADRFGLAADNLWTSHRLKSTPAEAEMERHAWRERNRDILSDLFEPHLAS